MRKTRYVVGFIVNEARDTVLLIRKNRPEWQAGLLNGIGGKIERGELEINAMMREAKEEAGVDAAAWRHFAMLHNRQCSVHCFVAIGDAPFVKAETRGDEPIVRMPLRSLRTCDVIPNLRWLLPMALDEDTLFATVEIEVKP